LDLPPGDEILLKKADNHWAEIKSGKVTYRIVRMPDRDFPKVPDHREAIAFTSSSCPADRRSATTGRPSTRSTRQCARALPAASFNPQPSSATSRGSRPPRRSNSPGAPPMTTVHCNHHCELVPVGRSGTGASPMCCHPSLSLLSQIALHVEEDTIAKSSARAVRSPRGGARVPPASS
jgi:hypothetical protein